jgi:predicted nucleic acid-binding protein
MKQAVTSDMVSDFSKVTLDKILTIEKDVMALKLSILRKLGPMGGKPLKLKGIIPDVEITDEDIAFAKSSLYGKTRI